MSVLVLFAKCVPAPRSFSESIEEAGVEPRAMCGGDEQPLTLGLLCFLFLPSLSEVSDVIANSQMFYRCNYAEVGYW